MRAMAGGGQPTSATVSGGIAPALRGGAMSGRRAAAARLAACVLYAAAGGCADPTHLRLLEPGSTSPHDAGTDLPDAPDASDAAPAEPFPPDAAQPDAGVAIPRLVLRYDFEGSGTRVVDLIGGADAQLMGGVQLDGMGGVTFDGVDDYADMPNGILSRHESVTIVVWIEWHGRGDDARDAWQRIFDFGVSDAGEGQVGNAVTSLFMTPSSLSRYALMVMAELRGTQEALLADGPLPSNRLVQVALSVDAPRSTVTMYLEGRAVSQRTLTFRLSDIDDVNNWLGRSQWVQDMNLRGRYEELRMYDGAVSGEQIAELYGGGPNAL